jgi:hypothetical protein
VTLKYTKTAYGLEPEPSVFAELPRNAKPISTAPIGSTPITVYESDDGRLRAHKVIQHLGRWMQVESVFDSFSGKHRTACTGDIVNNPLFWSPSS